MNAKNPSGAPLDEAAVKSRRGFLIKGAIGVAMLPLAARMAGCGNNNSTTPPIPVNNPDMATTPPPADMATAVTGYSSTDVQILATGYQVEKMASNTYTTAAGLGKLMDPFLTIAVQIKADHDANAAVFMAAYNAAKTPSDPALVAPQGDLTTVFPPKAAYPLSTDTNILIYALGLEILASQVYASLATTTSSQGMVKFAAALKVPATLSISRTNLPIIAAATDVSSNELQHAMALRAAIVLFKAGAAATFILGSAGTPIGGAVVDYDTTKPATFPTFFGSSVTAQNPNDYLA